MARENADALRESGVSRNASPVVNARTMSYVAQGGIYAVVFGVIGWAALSYMPLFEPWRDLRGYALIVATCGAIMITASVIRFFAFPVPPAWHIRQELEHAFACSGWLACEARLTYKGMMRINQRKGYAEQRMWINNPKVTIPKLRQVLNEGQVIRRLQYCEVDQVKDGKGRYKWLLIRLWFVAPAEMYGDGNE